MKKMISRSSVLIFLTAVIFFGFPYAIQAETWLVGPDFRLKKPSAAIKLANDGDTIKIMAGVYENDYAIISQDNLTLIGMNGLAHLKSSGHVPGGKAIWVTNGNNITIRNIEFSGAQVPDRNGAGIRLQRGSLIIDGCYFHDNEMGIMTSGKSNSRLAISNSEFSHNILIPSRMYNPGHNIYVGSIYEFILENSISRGTQYGHTVKSRARNNTIRNNRIFDEGKISASYLIEIPNGGRTLIENNYLYKNKGAQNNALISYGAEGITYAENSLVITYNTAKNEKGIAILLRNHSDIKVKFTGNKLTNISAAAIPGIERDSFWDTIKNTIRGYLK